MTDKTSLGDRMKMYEATSTSRKAFKGQPLIARLDGKNFHTFTKGLQRPFDKGLSDLMVFVTTQLVDMFQAKVGYTQSDEITLVWYAQPHETAEYPFDGRFQKIESLTAAWASVAFTANIDRFLPSKTGKLATFDCRAFVVPNLKEAYHTILWRQQDATKNAISMAAQSMFSHKSLQDMSGRQMQERMWKEKGVNFDHYPPFFKRGTFVKRHKILKELSPSEMLAIPEAHRPTGPVERTVITPFDCWLSKQEDPMQVLFGEGIPQVSPEVAG